MRFNDLGVEYVTPYPNASYFVTDNLKTFHGTKSTTGGSTMRSVIAQETVSCIQGHSNRAEIVYRTFMDGRSERTIFGANPGAMCDFDTIPSARHARNEHGSISIQGYDWQSAPVGVYYDDERAVPFMMPIDENGIQIFDKYYRS
jgi:hypothetical protein